MAKSTTKKPAQTRVKSTTKKKTTAKVAKKPTVKKAAAKKPVAAKSKGAKVTVKRVAPKKSPVRKPAPAATTRSVPAKSPVRAVESTSATSNSQFTGNWIVILMLVVAFVLGLAWYSEDRANDDYDSPDEYSESIDDDSYSEGFGPSVRIGN